METPQAILDPDGRIPAAAGRGGRGAVRRRPPRRLRPALAACDITAGHQSLTHPARDFARDVMQVSSPAPGFGSLTAPRPPCRSRLTGQPREARPLTPSQQEENREVVRAWRLHYDHVRRSLARGFYQSWDLHPGPARLALRRGLFLLLEEVENAPGASATSSKRPPR